MDILQPYLIGWLVPTVLAACAGFFAGKVKRLTARDKAIEEGVRCMLRAEISRKYERYVVDGRPMTAEVRRELEEEWHAYHDGLQGNGTGEAMDRELCEGKLTI